MLPIVNFTIKDAIEFLQPYDHNRIVKLGWGKGSGHSYRGYYHELGLEPMENVTIGEMISELKENIGAIHCGWKGGEFYYDENSFINLSEEGNTGTPISNILLKGLIEG